jgi:DNA-binding response OmpR family regulator
VGRNLKVLLVDDEESFVASLSYVLSREGYDVSVAYDGERALEMAMSEHPDLVLLDVMLPGQSGLEVCRQIKARVRAAIIMLTARDGEMDMVVGLEAGADDYVSKPFNLSVLLARIRAVLRRQAGAEEAVSMGPLVLMPGSYNARWDEVSLDLTPRLFQLLLLLAENPGKVLSRDEILDRVWGYEYLGQTRTVDVHIHWLREALAQASGSPDIIQTVRGVGYRLVIP